MFETHKRWKIFLLLTVSFVWFSGFIQHEVQFFQGKPAAMPGDFRVYYTAGLTARQADKRLYSYRETSDLLNPEKKIIVNPQLDFADPDSNFGRVSKTIFPAESDDATMQYLYPPFFAGLISPLTHFSFENAAKIWYALTFLFVFLAVFLTVKIFDEDYLTATVTAGAVTFLAEFIFPFQDLLWAGNVGALILFLYAAGIYFQRKNRPNLSTFFIVVAVFIKLTPIIIVPLMIVRRQWKWLGAFAGWSVLLFALSVWQLGWQNQLEFFTKIMPSMSAGIAERNNRSLLSIAQFVELKKVSTIDDIKSGTANSPESLGTIFKVFAALALLGLLYYLWRTDRSSANLTAEMYLLILLSLVVSPISWRHGYILALVPLVFIWRHPATQKSSSANLLLLSAATIFVFSVLPDYALSAVNFFPFQLLMASLMPLSALTIMFLLLKIIRDDARRIIPQS